MIAKSFYLLKKIIFIIKSKEKILFTTNLKQPHQTIKVKPPFFITTPIQTISFLLKSFSFV
ncbi:hypothetical protein HPHPA14_1596 [Helicobacter pylori Hp A-14]|nr:hypothetical protein HPHPA14_1596 [Helicobacter pylori Hp A-14]